MHMPALEKKMDRQMQSVDLAFNFDGEQPLTTTCNESNMLVSLDVLSLLQSIDWEGFESNVIEGLYIAVQKFHTNFQDVPGTRAFQLAICTSIQHRKTSFDFETRQHALEHLRDRHSYLREFGDEAMEENASLAYNPSQADFKFWGFYTIEHPELNTLQDLSFDDRDQQSAIEQYIAICLQRVIQRATEMNAFEKLPHEDELWVGYSSPVSWYDHVKNIFAKI